MNAWLAGRSPIRVAPHHVPGVTNESFGPSANNWARPTGAERTSSISEAADGGLLRDPRATIDVNRYWCIDVAEEAVAMGRNDYPDAHWLWSRPLQLPLQPARRGRSRHSRSGLRFDIIAAYSVFTSTRRGDGRAGPPAQAMLAPGGTLAFTFIDPHYHSWPAATLAAICDGGWRRSGSKAPTSTFEALGCAPAALRYCILLNRHRSLSRRRANPGAPNRGAENLPRLLHG